MFSRLLLSAFLALSFISPLRAEPYSQKQLETWVDGLLAEMHKAGAETASHGAINYDPTSGKFSVADIKVTLPEKVWSLEKKEGKDASETIKIEPLVLTIARITADGLMMDGGNWTAAKLHMEKLHLGAKGKKGALIVEAGDYENISAPQMAASDLGKAPIESLITLTQQMSLKSSTVTGMVITADETDAKASHFRFGDMRTTDMVKGKAKLSTLAESTGLIRAEDLNEGGYNKDKIENVAIKMGAISTADCDFGLYADLLLEKPTHAGQKDLPLYSATSFDGVTLKSGDKFDFNIRAFKTGNARITIPEKGMLSILRLFNEDVLTEAIAEKAETEWMKSYGNWSGMIIAGTFDWAGFSLHSPDVQMELKSAAGQDVGATIGALTFNNFSMKAPELTAGFDTVNLKKIDTSTFTKALYEEMAKNADSPNFKNLEGKLPTFGLVEVNNLLIQSKDEPALQAKRVAFGLESWAKFLPTHFYFTVENMVFPANAFADLEFPNLKDLGYEKLTFNSDMQFNYTEGTKVAAFAPVKFDFSEAGNVSSELKLIDIDSSKLGDMIELATQLNTAKFEKLMLALNNGNFLDRYIAWKAKAGGKSEQSVRDEMALMMKMLVVVIPDETQKKKANEAIDAFIASPKNLTVTITPKSKLTLLDLQLGAMANQMGLLNKVNFEVVANQGGL